MILTFKERFVEPILNSTKIHTIREDKYNRWKKGMKIHFWCGNPRNITKNPYQFAEGTVCQIIRLIINKENDIVLRENYLYKKEHLDRFARWDGLKDWEDMKRLHRKYAKKCISQNSWGRYQTKRLNKG